MITTVTTTTTTVVATTTTTTAAAISITTSLAIIGTIVLISLLIVKELLSTHDVERTQFLSDKLSIAIVPLLMMFALIVFTKIVDVLHL
jgi:glucan phosphoethanolaminetransferase (alkaline phosphatase superfamily)